MREGQLKTYEQAVRTPEQHKRPCVDCPFGRISLQGWLGPYDTRGWLEVVHGEGRMECHTMKAAEEEAWQCAGGAIFRANVHKAPRDGALLVLPRDDRRVFGSNREFWEHHTKEPFPWGTKP
jgi:hypothetical protein